MVGRFPFFAFTWLFTGGRIDLLKRPFSANSAWLLDFFAC